MHKNLYWGKLGLESWMRHIGNDVNDETVGVEVEIGIKIGVWSTQRSESLLHLIRKLELDK